MHAISTRQARVLNIVKVRILVYFTVQVLALYFFDFREEMGMVRLQNPLLLDARKGADELIKITGSPERELYVYRALRVRYRFALLGILGAFCFVLWAAVSYPWRILPGAACVLLAIAWFLSLQAHTDFLQAELVKAGLQRTSEWKAVRLNRFGGQALVWFVSMLMFSEVAIRPWAGRDLREAVVIVLILLMWAPVIIFMLAEWVRARGRAKNQRAAL